MPAKSSSGMTNLTNQSPIRSCWIFAKWICTNIALWYWDIYCMFLCYYVHDSIVFNHCCLTVL